MAVDFETEIKNLRTTMGSVRDVTDVPALEARIADLEQQAAAPDLWDDPDSAQGVTSALSRANAELERIQSMDSRIEDLEALVELGREEGDAETLVEAGTHRLARISPFGSADKRQTSFAAVEVIPLIEGTDSIEIPENELKIDVFRSSGPGGQSVNTTDSAVRMTHIPTGIVVSMQNEKSQIQNRAAALRVMQSRLLLAKKAEEAAERKELAGDVKASWGDQMRSYVLNPYQMVKDLRTEHETGNPSAVFDGDIDAFIEAGIRWRIEQAKSED